MFSRVGAVLPSVVAAPDGTEVVLRRSARARRLVLTVSRATGKATLTLPAHAAERDALSFIAERADWIARARAQLPPPAIIREGVLLPVGGLALRIEASATPTCRVHGGALLVPQGRPVGPTVAAWLRERARVVLTASTRRYAEALPPGARSMTALSLRDTRSRWGSCSAEGRLMFNWRLSMAPAEICDYVAAHEVAHLAHLDHSPAFWAVVARLMPDYATRRDWLRRHGPALLSWQFR